MTIPCERFSKSTLERDPVVYFFYAPFQSLSFSHMQEWKFLTLIKATRSVGESRALQVCFFHGCHVKERKLYLDFEVLRSLMKSLPRGI
jgi:hypothetical protein